MTRDEEIARAHQAERLLNDPLFQEAFAVVEAEYLDGWRNSPARDTEGRERLWLMLKLLGKVRGHLQTVMETGKLAEKQLTAIEPKRRLFG